ncbi:unnamed protein product, partial [Rotaria magnacalcarata]
KIAVDDLTKLQQRTLPRSKSEVNTIPMEQPHDHHRQQQQQQTTTSIQIKPIIAANLLDYVIVSLL